MSTHIQAISVATAKDIGTALFMLIAALALLTAQSGSQFDVLIQNGRLVDGTGSPWRYADVAVLNGRIAAVGKVKGSATQTIEASGLVVAPGFIDMLGQSEFHILVDNRAASKLLQGVTTEITGEGGSIAPLNDWMIREGGVRNGKTPFREFGIDADWRTLSQYFKRIRERTHPAINLGTFVGAGGIRDYVIGKESRPATSSEMEA